MPNVRVCITAAVSEGGMCGGQAGREHERARRGPHDAADRSVSLIAARSFQLVLLHLRQDLRDTLLTFLCSTLGSRL